jgi:phage antirepressor YoqD-like protein
MRRALDASGNHISQAAKLVGTSRQNFSNWMREYKVEPSSPST